MLVWRTALVALIEMHKRTGCYRRSRGIVDVAFAITEDKVFCFLGPNAV